MYYVEVRHEGLGKYRYIKGNDKYVVEQKAAAQRQQWDAMWSRRQAFENSRSSIFGEKEKARQRSKAAVESLEELDSILDNAVRLNHAINWENLKTIAKFDEPAPQRSELGRIPVKPHDADYLPIMGWLDAIFPPLKSKKIARASEAYNAAVAEWRARKQSADRQNNSILAKDAANFREWELKKQRFDEDLAATNQALELQKARYFAKDAEAIREYCDMVLAQSQYPD
jgi:restriction system protein